MQFKDNKVTIIYLVIAFLVLVGGGVGAFITHRSTVAVEEEAEKQVASVESLLRGGGAMPIPTKENVLKLESQNETSVQALEELIGALGLYTFADDGSNYPSQASIGEISAENITRETYGKFLQDVFEVRRKKFQELGISVPDNFYLGMEGYERATPASNNVAKFLAYQLGAIESILDVLSTQQVDSLQLIRARSGPEVALASESGDETTSSTRNSSATPEEDKRVAHAHSLRISFSSNQEVLQNLLNFFANNEDYFFIVNSLSIENEKKEAPTVEGVENELSSLRSALETMESSEESADFEVFGGTEDADPEFELTQGDVEDSFTEDSFDSEAPAVAVQVLGDERLQVDLEVFLITFRQMLSDAEEEEPQNEDEGE